MNVFEQRMQNLLRANREAPPENFHMSYFASFCGTPGCLLGNYAVRTDLQEDFGILKFPHYEWQPYALADLNSGEPNSCNSASVLSHFGITTDEANDLFCTDGCEDARQDRAKAIAYVEAFCGRKWPKPALDPGYVKLRSSIEVSAALRETA